MIKKERMNLQLFGGTEGGEAGAGESKGGDEGTKKDTKEETKENTAGGSKDEPKFNQADIDKAVKDRLARETKKFQKQLDDLKSQFTDGGAENSAEGDTKGEDTHKMDLLLATANQRLVEATATTEAVKLGVDPKYISDVVKLANLSGIEVGEDGTINVGEISKLLDEVVKRVPAFKTATEAESGFKVGGDGSSKQQKNSGWGNPAKQTEPQSQKRWNKTNRW